MPIFRRVMVTVAAGLFVAAFAAPLPGVFDIAAGSQVATLFHLLAYAGFTAFVILRRRHGVAISAVGVLVLSVVLELAQIAVPGRFFGVGDLMANTVGVTVGTVAALALLHGSAMRGMAKPV